MLIINVAFWALYLQSSSESHLLVLSMTNAVVRKFLLATGTSRLTDLL